MSTSEGTHTYVGDLADHLRQYGIRHFANNDYYLEWGAKRLGPMLTDQVDRMREQFRGHITQFMAFLVRDLRGEQKRGTKGACAKKLGKGGQ